MSYTDRPPLINALHWASNASDEARDYRILLEAFLLLRERALDGEFENLDIKIRATINNWRERDKFY